MQSRPSRTAQHVALFRALESVRRGPRLFTDPYAASCLGPGLRLAVTVARFPGVARFLERRIDRRWPAGPRASAVVRTRLIDDLVVDALENGARRLVLLGAGYDSRAFRLDAARTAAVLEVDHPATQAVKRGLAGTWSARAGRPGDRVRFVPADLMREDLGDVLRDAGPGDDRAVVVWEGVTNYLDAASVHATLTALGAALAPGSRIVLTYMDRRALDGTGDFDGVTAWADTVRAAGEPFTFGFLPDELPAYLAERGLELTLDQSARDAAARYLEPLGRHEPAAPFYRIAQAEVK
ncbi:class I SAM-dependent methyltransferase [Actinacidiphila glaucinigra]|uniref:S-adenosyl-L-methionine-dependent methyltransferase n=1 Tax=Actinacidiphila glaucinigra TaxID=235986 RepID=A0A239KVX5_9ACTN|nr:SAM-dependent methyltransferase [Actinacidiphila glaucinigra]SNT22527.1 methyltransferase, TIGR00027 family [Actinacidiphila glaucinigra]